MCAQAVGKRHCLGKERQILFIKEKAEEFIRNLIAGRFKGNFKALWELPVFLTCMLKWMKVTFRWN